MREEDFFTKFAKVHWRVEGERFFALPPRGKAPSHDALDVFTPILLVAVAAYVPRTSLASAQKSLGVALPDRLLARRGD